MFGLAFSWQLGGCFRASHDEAVLVATPERIDLLHNEVSQILAKRRLFSGIAASRRGKLLHTAATKVPHAAQHLCMTFLLLKFLLHQAS